MVKKYEIMTVGKESFDMRPVDRPDGVSDEEYGELAREAGLQVKVKLGELGVRARVIVASVDAQTPEETARELSHAADFEAAGGHLPSTAEVIAQV